MTPELYLNHRAPGWQIDPYLINKEQNDHWLLKYTHRLITVITEYSTTSFNRISNIWIFPLTGRSPIVPIFSGRIFSGDRVWTRTIVFYLFTGADEHNARGISLCQKGVLSHLADEHHNSTGWLRLTPLLCSGQLRTKSWCVLIIVIAKYSFVTCTKDIKNIQLNYYYTCRNISLRHRKITQHLMRVINHNNHAVTTQRTKACFN